MSTSFVTVADAVLREAARASGAVHHVHPHDYLFDYLLKRDGQGAIAAYFAGGSSDAMQARRALDRSRIGDDAGRRLKVLEFAAGYGRVARHAHVVFADHHYVASDIHPAAVEFLATSCGIEAALSAHEPETLNVGGGYDYIFVLSLFSHLPDHSFGRWLAALYALLADRGVLLFTTHGDAARRKFPVPFENMLDVDRGWGYGRDSDQPDLAGDEYGTMVVTPRYVLDAIEAHCPHGELVRFDAGVWFGLQDEWLVRKHRASPAVPAGVGHGSG